MWVSDWVCVCLRVDDCEWSITYTRDCLGPCLCVCGRHSMCPSVLVLHVHYVECRHGRGCVCSSRHVYLCPSDLHTNTCGLCMAERTTYPCSQPVSVVAYSPDGQYLAAGDTKREVYGFETSTGECTCPFLLLYNISGTLMILPGNCTRLTIMSTINFLLVFFFFCWSCILRDWYACRRALQASSVAGNSTTPASRASRGRPTRRILRRDHSTRTLSSGTSQAR